MSTFIIRNKDTLQQWVAASGKRSWNKPNHAKAAFANSYGSTKRDPLLKEFVKNLSMYESLKFNDQNVYEVVEVYADRENMKLTKLKEVSEKLADLKDTVTRYSEGLTLEQYDILHGDIEMLQYLVFEIIENQLTTFPDVLILACLD